jgi:hypothetical protein
MKYDNQLAADAAADDASWTRTLNWAAQAQERTRGICPDPAAHKLHTDGRWMFETCPWCGHDEPLKTCTGCGQMTCQLVPWSGQRLCWDCTDTQLDLMAKAVTEDALVTVAVAR